MPNYCVLRIKKLKSQKSVEATGAHCLRTQYTPNADSSADAPGVVVGTGNFEHDLQRRYDEVGVHKKRKNGVVALEIVMSASAGFFRPTNPLKYGSYEQDQMVKFTELVVAWVEEVFENKNVVAVVRHLDEGTPHVHALIAPLDSTPTPKGKTRTRQNAKRWTGGFKKMSALQTSFANKMEPLGLVRGIAGSRASYQQVKKHYGALHVGVSPVPTPSVSTPPLTVRQSNREGWATQESERLAAEQKDVVERLAVQAQLGVNAQRRSDEMAATASYAQQQLRALETRLRDIELEGVARELGLTRSKIDKHKWKGPGFEITVTGQQYNDHCNNVGGGGAIGLVKYCMGIDDYLQAVAWLVDRYGDEAAERSIASFAKTYVATAKNNRNPYQPPVQSSAFEDWGKVREYLIGKRAMNGSVIDYLHDKGMIYAAVSKGPVSCVFKAIRENCAEIMGIGVDDYKGLAPGSSPSIGGFRVVRNKEKSDVRNVPLVIVSSAIEVLSFWEICDYDCEIISTCGCEPGADFIHDAIQKGRVVVVGCNSDDSGRGIYQELTNYYSSSKSARFIKTQFPPSQYDDWNDCLRALKNEYIATEKKGEINAETEGNDTSSFDLQGLR